MRVNIYAKFFSLHPCQNIFIFCEMHTKTHTDLHMKGISVFRHQVGEYCVHLSYYSASSGNSLPTFRDNIGPIFKSQ
jgi:hypothetical protein